MQRVSPEQAAARACSVFADGVVFKSDAHIPPHMQRDMDAKQ
jgi:hypothetical protein